MRREDSGHLVRSVIDWLLYPSHQTERLLSGERCASALEDHASGRIINLQPRLAILTLQVTHVSVQRDWFLRLGEAAVRLRGAGFSSAFTALEYLAAD